MPKHFFPYTVFIHGYFFSKKTFPLPADDQHSSSTRPKQAKAAHSQEYRFSEIIYFCSVSEISRKNLSKSLM